MATVNVTMTQFHQKVVNSADDPFTVQNLGPHNVLIHFGAAPAESAAYLVIKPYEQINRYFGAGDVYAKVAGLGPGDATRLTVVGSSVE